MSTLSATPSHRDASGLAASLAPLIVQACEGRLAPITWFKTDWQRGGAATGASTFLLADGQSVPVVVKVPVVQRELLWTKRLNQSGNPHSHTGAHGGPSPPSAVVDQQSTAQRPLPIANRSFDSVVPRLYASGESIGGYDLAWIVIERLPHGPLGLHWHENHVLRIVEAAARFQAAADAYPVDATPTREDWPALLHEAAVSVRTNRVAHEQRWSVAIKTLRHRLSTVLQQWHARDVNHWLHGDVHLANAMSRHGIDSGDVCLIDLAEVHAGHWVEDAVYLERQLWARPERLATHKPVKALAQARKALGLTVEGDYPRLAMIRRALLASTAPKFIKSEGHPVYLDACLNRLETALKELK